MPTMFVATKDGLATFDDRGRQLDGAHAGRSVTALGRMRDDVWAILDAAELWHAPRSGWTHVADLDTGLRATCLAGIGSDVFVGTSGARLFRLTGEMLEPVPAFDDAPGLRPGTRPGVGRPTRARSRTGTTTSM